MCSRPEVVYIKHPAPHPYTHPPKKRQTKLGSSCPEESNKRGAIVKSNLAGRTWAGWVCKEITTAPLVKTVAVKDVHLIYC